MYGQQPAMSGSFDDQQTYDSRLDGAKGSCEAPAQLVVIQGAPLGKAQGVRAATTTIGRHPDCDLVLSSAAVSRYHAKVTCEGDTYRVSDAGSRNGVLLNGRTLAAEEIATLRHKDVIQMSDCQVLFLRCQGEEELNTLATIHLDRQQIGEQAEELFREFLDSGTVEQRKP